MVKNLSGRLIPLCQAYEDEAIQTLGFFEQNPGALYRWRGKFDVSHNLEDVGQRLRLEQRSLRR